MRADISCRLAGFKSLLYMSTSSNLGLHPKMM